MALGGAGSPELASCQRHHLQDDCTSSGASGPGGGAGHGRGQNSAFAQSSDSSALQAGAALTSCLSQVGRGDGWSGISEAGGLPQWSPRWRHTLG